MNIRKIVTYNALRRQFTVEELAFAEVLFNATESERELLITALQPEKSAGKKAGKKSSTSKSSQSSTKSSRASGMAAQLKERRQEQREATTDEVFDELSGSFERCPKCGSAPDANVHHLQTDPNYHPFVSTTPPAPAPSPANGGVGSITQNSEASAASAGAATGGSGE